MTLSLDKLKPLLKRSLYGWEHTPKKTVYTTKLTENNLWHIIKILNSEEKYQDRDVTEAMTWVNTPQGQDYWEQRYCGGVRLTEEDFKYLRSLLPHVTPEDKFIESDF